MKTISLVMLALALATVPLTAGEPAAKDKDLRMDVDFKNASLYEVQNALRTATGANFVIDRAAFKQEDGKAREIKVDMQLKNVKVETVLNLLAKLYGLSFTTVDDVVIITRPGRVTEGPITLVFDVFDLSVLRQRPSYFSNVRNFGAYQNGYGRRFSSIYYSPEEEYYERWLDEQRPLPDGVVVNSVAGLARDNTLVPQSGASALKCLPQDRQPGLHVDHMVLIPVPGSVDDIHLPMAIKAQAAVPGALNQIAFAPGAVGRMAGLTGHLVPAAPLMGAPLPQG